MLSVHTFQQNPAKIITDGLMTMNKTNKDGKIGETLKPTKTYETVKQPEGSKLCGAACMAMICGYDLPMLYSALSEMHPGRTPFNIEEELEEKYPHFCHLIDICSFLAHHGYMAGIHAQASNAENGGRMGFGDTIEILVPVRIADAPALVGIDSENHRGKLHWVFWDGKVVRDPNPKKPDERPLSDLDGHIYDWIPLIRLEPFDESVQW